MIKSIQDLSSAHNKLQADLDKAITAFANSVIVMDTDNKIVLGIVMHIESCDMTTGKAKASSLVKCQISHLVEIVRGLKTANVDATRDSLESDIFPSMN